MNTNNTLDDVIQKISTKVVTCEDFNLLISEALGSSTIDRVRRRTRRTPTDNHIDAEGHQGTALPTFGARVAPQRENNGSDQMKHRGKSAHRRSTRTQQRRAGKFSEAIEFVKQYHTKPLTECKAVLDNIVDHKGLQQLVTRMMSTGKGDHDWLYAVMLEQEKYVG